MVNGEVTVEVPEFVPLTALCVGHFSSTNHAELFLWSGAALRPAKNYPKRLVLAAVQDETKPQPAKTLQRALRNSPFFAPSLEGKGQGRPPFRGVVTFEISLHDIVGLDYLNPLLVDASRLSVEATRITRRWFPTLEHCSDHYGWSLGAAASALAAVAAVGCGSVASAAFAAAAAELTEPRGEKRDDGFVTSSGLGKAAAPSEAQATSVSRLVSEMYRPRSQRRDEQGQPAQCSLQRIVPHTDRCRAPTSPSRPAYWQEHPEEQRFQTINSAALCVDRVVRWFSKDMVSHGGFSSYCEEDTADYEEVIRPQTLSFRFDDPFLPYVLREVIHDPEFPELLRLYEAGLPAWAIYMPMYTGLYRRWMRLAVSCITVLISCITMLLGFYDLYKRIPAVRVLLKQVLGPLSSTLEEFVVVRFSVVVAWILPYNVIFHRCWHMIRWLAEGCRWFVCSCVWVITSTASVANSVIGPSFAALWLTVYTIIQPLCLAFGAAATACESTWQALSAVVGACRGALWALTRCVGALFGARAQVGAVTNSSLLKGELTSVRQACMSIYNGTIFVSAKIARHQASMRLSFYRWRVSLCGHIIRRLQVHPSKVGFAVTAVIVSIILRATHGSLDAFVSQVLPDFLVNAEPQKWLSDLCYGMASTGKGPFSWRFVLSPILCRSLRLWLSQEPAIMQVNLLCGADDQVCWKRHLDGGRRCQCPYHHVQGLNFTTDRLGTWAIEVAAGASAPRSHAELPLSCSGGTWCYIDGSAVRGLLQGEPSAELLFLRAWQPMLKAGGHRALVAAEAAFVVELPRYRATGPHDVRLCIAGSVAQDRHPLSKVLPQCGFMGDRLGEVESVSANITHTGLSLAAEQHRAGGAFCGVPDRKAAPSASSLLRASWSSGPFGSCSFVAWEVFLHTRQGAPAVAPWLVCNSYRPRDRVCSGSLEPRESGSAASLSELSPVGTDSVLTSLSAKTADIAPPPSGIAYGRGGAFAVVRAEVRLRCSDVQDAPREASFSPIYAPLRTSVRQQPLRHGTLLAVVWSPVLLGWEACRLAWWWTISWVWGLV